MGRVVIVPIILLTIIMATAIAIPWIILSLTPFAIALRVSYIVVVVPISISTITTTINYSSVVYPY